MIHSLFELSTFWGPFGTGSPFGDRSGQDRTHEFAVEKRQLTVRSFFNNISFIHHWNLTFFPSFKPGHLQFIQSQKHLYIFFIFTKTSLFFLSLKPHLPNPKIV